MPYIPVNEITVCKGCKKQYRLTFGLIKDRKPQRYQEACDCGEIIVNKKCHDLKVELVTDGN